MLSDDSFRIQLAGGELSRGTCTESDTHHVLADGKLFFAFGAAVR